ncbi:MULTISPECIES: hypothetical protein [unclassified Synechococcus]|uniref:hypothetical protein n=1 Tax=unclassified Synechococcus TaxID=2626047 RepID=UPI0021A78CD6|nr:MULTISPECIES: hypothetical protein [unclassified Synechococcus]MCT0214296.1 hypothetical protein [Synechococcus sp. CS-1326]MCT0234460.1 hypothetical protein [Synechococcus sp. CS-1327]
MDNHSQGNEDNLLIDRIHALSMALRSSPNLASMVRSSTNPQQIVDIAQSLNIEISIPLLRKFSSQLSAPYWPWENQNSEMRRKFFED